jgi:hypothetical protein
MLAAITFLFACRAVVTCSCVVDSSRTLATRVGDNLQSASAAFVGTVIRRDTVAGEYLVLHYTFRVDERLKGVEADSIWILGGAGINGCAMSFSVGRSYIVFAAPDFQKTQFITANVCGLTTPLAGADSVLALVRSATRKQRRSRPASA